MDCCSRATALPFGPPRCPLPWALTCARLTTFVRERGYMRSCPGKPAPDPSGSAEQGSVGFERQLGAR